MVKVVAAADLHVDATTIGRFNPKLGMHENWAESFRQLGNIVDTCNEVDADLLCIAGDTFNTGRPVAEAVSRTIDAFKRLRRTKVAFVNGNHDQQSVVGNHRTPVDAYLADQPFTFAAASEPRVVDFNGLYLAMSPWLRVAGSTQLEQTSRTLEGEVKRLAEECEGRTSLFFGHVVTDECTFDSGRRSSELQMATGVLEAVCRTEVLDEGPWAVARLGHIHKRQQLSAKTGFIGSSYKVSFGETRDAKGCDVITFNGNEAEVEFRQFEVRELYKYDVSSVGSDSVRTAVESAKPGDYVRFVLDALGLPEPAGFADVREMLVARGVNVQVFRNPKDSKNTGSRVQGLGLDTTPTRALDAYMDQQGVDKAEQVALRAEFATLLG